MCPARYGYPNLACPIRGPAITQGRVPYDPQLASPCQRCSPATQCNGTRVNILGGVASGRGATPSQRIFFPSLLSPLAEVAGHCGASEPVCPQDLCTGKAQGGVLCPAPLSRPCLLLHARVSAPGLDPETTLYAHHQTQLRPVTRTPCMLA